MAADQVIRAHGGGGEGWVDALVGLGPVLLGVVLIGGFIALLATDRSGARRRGYRDSRPAPGRLLFSGVYYQLEEAFHQPDYVRPEPAGVASGTEDRGSESAEEK
jgi:hypothetical protein